MSTPYLWRNIFSFLLSSIFVLYASLEIWSLRGASIKVVTGFQSHIKAGLAVAFSIVQLISLLTSTAVSDSYLDKIPAIVSVLAAFELCLLLSFGHRRTVRPSTTVILYIGLSFIKDLIALTLPSGNLQPAGTSLLVVRVVLELSIIVKESQSKTRILKPRYLSLTPEERTGILGRVLFWWINPVLGQGYRDVLDPDELPGIDRALSSKVLRKRVIHAWRERLNPETKFTLPLILFQGFRREFLLPILPRLFLIVFRYSQPMLIGITIDFIQNERINSGYWLVLLTGLIYCGLTISTSTYQHKLNRLQLITRGALLSLIHARALRAESSPGRKALTLMSSDVDSIDTAAEMFHETWAQFTEVLIGTTLLSKQIGWFAFLPLIIIFGCSRISAYVAKHLQGRQKDWSAATQGRLTMIAAVLSGIKSMKILGLEEATRFLVSNLRAREIAMSNRLRWIMVAYNASANALGIFSPVLTLVLFAISRKEDTALNPDTIFTSIALLALVTHPANMVMTLIPRAVAALANFERIQTYLTTGLLLDQRVFISLNTATESEYKLGPGQRLAVLIENVKIQPPSSLHPILDGVNIRMNRGSIFMCSGLVGSGKSILALSILGEIAPKEGRIIIADEPIAFCSQVVWLPTGSIREVICEGAGKVDEDWYNTVIQACGLNTDLETLTERDMTWVGSGGINLSGGQKARIALARAVYSRCSILVLDDPFSALDGEVESHVVTALFGSRGILRQAGTTVFLITNSAQYYALADKIVLLDDGRVQVLDPQDEIVLAKTQIKKTNISQNGHKSEASQNNAPALADRKRMEDAAADVSRRTGDLALYGYYFRSVGTFGMLLMASCTAIYSFCLTFSQYVLKWWTESNTERSWPYILSYFMLSLMAWIATNGTMWSTHIVIAPKSGSILHARLLEKILNAPLSYFSTFEVGNILNRFGQDIQLVDKQLPPAFSNLSVQIFKLLMQAIVLFAVQPYMAMTVPFCAGWVYFIQRIYLRTSRQLRFIDLESRSKLYTSFIETLDGIVTIRASAWEGEFELDNISKLDKSQSPLYLLLCLQRWLNVVLDLLVAGIALILIASAVALRNTATGAEIGVALNMIIAANTTLLRLVESWTSLETSLGAVSRLRSIDHDTPCEDKGWGYLEPSPQWPTEGSVKIKNLSAGYTPQALVLRDLNLNIQPGQRIVLCGRTGSGKSSLFLTLLRLLNPSAGSIEVENVDIANLPVQIVRRRGFIAVPQDPYLLPDASVRFNLDPYNQHEDPTLVQVLKQTGLWSHISSPSEFQTPQDTDTYSDIINKPLSTLPPVSVGQMQMFALAQALLRVKSRPSRAVACYGDIANSYDSQSRPRPIVILDEASASFDPETEMRMQELVKEEIVDKGYTVIMISHRDGNMLKDLRPGFDAVVWMQDGRVCGDDKERGS